MLTSSGTCSLSYQSFVPERGTRSEVTDGPYAPRQVGEIGLYGAPVHWVHAHVDGERLPESPCEPAACVHRIRDRHDVDVRVGGNGGEEVRLAARLKALEAFV